jgi:hypothetical protein
VSGTKEHEMKANGSRSRWSLIGWAAVLSLVGAAGCGDAEPAGLQPADAPNFLDKADGPTDLADTSCFAVLRSVGRVSNNMGGYLDTCAAGLASSDCRYLWEGFIDVDAARLGDLQTVEVLYQTGTTQGLWYAVVAEPVTGAEQGFARYRFRITEHTPSPGMSFTSLNRTTIDLAPYVTTASGRVFDHNRMTDPLDSYHLRLDNGWTIQSDGSCPPRLDVPEYRLSFPDWNESLVGGPLMAGAQVKLVYDGRRLRETQPCMGGQAAVSSTTLVAYWMFDGDSQNVQSAEVESYIESYGYACNGASPCITDRVSQPVIDLPAGAASLSMWFGCIPMGQGSPAAYDSNMGSNYSLEIAPADPVDPTLWVGAFVQLLSREAASPCDGGAALGEGFSFGTWARQRAAVTNVCFEVWKQGVTDWANPDLWQQLDVQVHTGFGDSEFASAYVNMVDQPGNNARYAIDLRGLDPFRSYSCPAVPVTTVDQGGEAYVQAELDFYVTVNGAEIRPAGPGSFFRGTFTDYAANPWREENCQ